MQISTEELDGGVTRVVLDGRLDIVGAAAVDLKMNIIAGSAKKLLIDLEKVTFLGSMGLRSIVIPSRVRFIAAEANGRPLCAGWNGGIGPQNQRHRLPATHLSRFHQPAISRIAVT